MIEGEVHDHAITSKVNLIDLAGSERQSLAKTSGDRLRVGIIILLEECGHLHVYERSSITIMTDTAA